MKADDIIEKEKERLSEYLEMTDDPSPHLVRALAKRIEDLESDMEFLIKRVDDLEKDLYVSDRC